jgi:transcription termination/antitermination protein NusA
MELSPEALEYFNVFESFTGVMPLEMVEARGALFFVVPSEKIGLVLAGHGKKIEELKLKVDRNIYVVADADDEMSFLRNLFNNVHILDTNDENIMGEKTLYLTVDEKDKSRALGKGKARLEGAKELMKRKFNVSLFLKTRLPPPMRKCYRLALLNAFHKHWKESA